MAGRHCEHELLHEQWRHLQVVADGKSEHSDVEAPDAQLVDDVVGLGLGQTQTEFGELCSNLGHDVGEEVRRNRGEEADPQGGCSRVAHFGGKGGNPVRLLDDDADPFEHALPRQREGDIARGTLEQDEPEFVFELADLGRQCRLTHAARRGGAPEVSVIGNRRHVLQIAKIHERERSRREDGAVAQWNSCRVRPVQRPCARHPSVRCGSDDRMRRASRPNLRPSTQRSA